MKKIFAIASLYLMTISYAQVIIGDALGTAPSNNKTSVLLEFANTNNKGLIVPYLRTVPTSTTEGTIILDAASADKARVKYFNGAWVDLSGQDANITTALSAQPNGVTETNSKAIIGAQTSAADGVLVLESTTKAMVLPQVDNVSKIVNPSPGMIVYINKAGSKRLAVYNGAKWSFWKP